MTLQLFDNVLLDIISHVVDIQTYFGLVFLHFCVFFFFGGLAQIYEVFLFVVEIRRALLKPRIEEGIDFA